MAEEAAPDVWIGAEQRDDEVVLVILQGDQRIEVRLEPMPARLLAGAILRCAGDAFHAPERAKEARPNG
jgi:hypothetical protein